MVVEESRGVLGGSADKFPVGMRVLAVDDDPTCLMLLGGLLRKCQYQVTMESQARNALKMLRENRNRFDLIISDVYMPDMDGFKLLELVGLEMDLPVIMLSANSDPKLVMKGITHGACDYLVKPVRIEELRNIWQHVIRRKKFESKSQNNSATQDKDQEGSEGVHGPAGNTDQNGKLNRKRKDEEEEECDENGHENDDPSSQKKARVVWSIELHRKFVGAVNQLGIEKAVPKRILDMMNVEGLTRENVASHLQKYRLYLKRISSVASQQANMVAALGGNDSPYMRTGFLDGLADFRTLTGSGRLPNTALSSYPSSGMLGRLNSPSGVGLLSLTSSALIQPTQAQNLSNSINALGKFQPVVSPINPQNFNPIENPGIFAAAGTFTDTRVAVGNSGNSLTGAPSNSLILHGTPQTGGGFTNQSSLNADSFNLISNGSIFLDQERCNENWQNAIQLSQLPSNQLPSNGMRYNNSSTRHHIQNTPIEYSSNTVTISGSLEDSRSVCQEGLVGEIVQNMNQPQNQWRGRHTQGYTRNSNNGFGALNSLGPANAVAGPLSQSVDQNGTLCNNRRIGIPLADQSNGGVLTPLQHGEVEKSTVDFKIRSNEDYALQQTKSQGGFVPRGYDSVDYLMNAMMKREQDGMILADGEFGFDAYSFGSSCI